MKTIGVIVLVFGALAFLVGFNMDTTVAADDYGSRRVHNIGLMNDRQNIIIFAGVLAVIGTLLFALAGKNKQPTLTPEGSSSASTGTRKCPFCAEYVKTEAVICRFCQKELPLDSSPNRAEEEKKTPANSELLNAIKQGNLSTVLSLLNYGIPAYGIDADGHLLMAVAEKTNDKNMIEILKKYHDKIAN